MKTIGYLFIIIVVVGVLIFILPSAKDYFLQSRQQADGAIAGKISNDYLVGKAGQEIGVVKERVKKQLVGLIEAKAKLANQRAELEGKKKDFASKTEALEVAKNWLKSHKPGDAFTNPAGKQFSFAEVESGSKQTLEAAKAVSAAIQALSESSDILASSIDEANAAYEDNLSQIKKAEGDLESKRVQLEAWEVVKETKAIAQGLDTSVISSGSGSAMAEIQKRLTAASVDRKMSSDTAYGKRHGVEEIISPTAAQDTAAEIDAFLGNKPEAAPVPAPAAESAAKQ